jgi:hypothetical protein
MYISRPEAEKLEEKHHNAQHAHTPYLLALHWLLFELWGLSTLLYLNHFGNSAFAFLLFSLSVLFAHWKATTRYANR